MKKFAAALAVAVISMLGLGAAARAYPPAGAALLFPSTVAPGADFTVTLTGCALGEVVQFTVAGDSASSTCTGPAGSSRGFAGPAAASASGTLTAPTAPGTYTITARGLTSGLTVTATLTVAAPAAGGALPTTGSDSAPITQIAAGIVLAGLGLTGVALYRRRSNAAA